MYNDKFGFPNHQPTSMSIKAATCSLEICKPLQSQNLMLNEEFFSKVGKRTKYTIQMFLPVRVFLFSSS